MRYANLPFRATLLVSICLFPAVSSAQEMVTELRITTLSTMLTDLRGVGEWGYAALVETNHGTILFDTGERPGTVLENAGELGLDLGEVETVVLTHHHFDHTGGLVTLRKHFQDTNPAAMARTHVGEGMFLPRNIDQEAFARIPIRPPPELLVSALDVKSDYEALGGQFEVHDEPHELAPGVWLTGPIPRVHPERNWTTFERIESNGELIEDTIPEDQALVLDTPKGLVIVVGCGHAGIVNTMEFAREILPGRPIHGVLGGFHLLNQTDENVAWSGDKMREFGVEHVVGAHCTGIHAMNGLRAAAKLIRQTAVVGAVGTVFTLDQGIQTGALNR
jgi:7,8-dihydropterin-6-yl-methyl-4-(beta-D-ribofuranosyl)aminobenzene 5'-phosphate synthase